MTKEEKEKLIQHLKYSLEIGADYTITDGDIVEIIKALEQVPCEDAISRQEALNAITMAEVRWQAIDNINKLTSVTPKTGHWINVYPDVEPNPMFWHWNCSVCDFEVIQSIFKKLKYCPNCGTKMQEQQENEVIK